MTRQEYLAQDHIQAALRLRLTIVGGMWPRDPNLLGYVGIAFGFTKDGVAIVEETGLPLIVTALLVSTN